MKQAEIKFLMDTAHLTAARSSAVRLKVGAVVADTNGNIIATGYNGTVRGFHTNCCEHEVDGKLITNEDITIHAEQNVLMHAARRGVSVDNCIVCTTISPCAKCTSLMIQAGIQEVIYDEQYRLFDQVHALYKNYINLTQYIK